MKLTPQSSDPQVVKVAKWGTAVLGFLALLFTIGVATIKTGVQWASAPLVRDESRARQVGDSLIVSRLEAMDRKQDQLAWALSYPEGSAERARMLRRVWNIEPTEVVMPEGTQGPGAEEKK